jgi:hypothetical protein
LNPFGGDAASSKAFVIPRLLQGDLAKQNGEFAATPFFRDKAPFGFAVETDRDGI